MSSLYKRATPSQVRILRAVEGAIRNASHAHPDKQIDRHMTRSIAKRAAGTLSAQWPSVLAARCAPSDRKRGELVDPRSHAHSEINGTVRGRGGHFLTAKAKAGGDRQSHRRPLVLLWRELTRQMRAVKLSGNVERERAYIDVLKMIAKLQQKDASNP